jgi:hypothetical protein
MYLLCMNYILTEQQLRIIVKEEKNSKLTNYMKFMYSFTHKVVSISKKKYGLNVRFLLTMGTAIGGFLLPLDMFLKQGIFELTEDQTALILTGVAAINFYGNRKNISNIIDKIKEEGLLDYFQSVLEKSDKLRKSFVGFLESLSLTLSSVQETISYAFLLPLITDFMDIAHGTQNFWEASEIVTERLLASGVVVISGQILIEVINKILKRVS